MPARIVRAKAYAKINLDLRVIGRRADGYHEVLTLMQTVGLHDDLTVKKTDRSGIELVCVGEPKTPAGRANLVYRAAEALCSEGHSQGGGVSIRLRKRIPMGAGLGGGSSDAAATLLAVHRLLRLGMPPRELERIAGQIGSDVPFFLQGGLAAAGGRGEKIRPIAAALGKKLHVVLACPNIHVSTPDAYRWFAGSTRTLPLIAVQAAGKELSAYARRMRTACVHGRWSGLRNDLEPPVFDRNRVLAGVKSILVESGSQCAQMTGSGSSVYGLYERIDAARSACRRLRNAGYRAFLTGFVDAGLGRA